MATLDDELMPPADARTTGQKRGRSCSKSPGSKSKSSKSSGSKSSKSSKSGNAPAHYELNEHAPHCLVGLLKAPLAGLRLHVRIRFQDLLDYKNNDSRRAKELMEFVMIDSIEYIADEQHAATHAAMRDVLGLVKVNGVFKFRRADTLKRPCSIFRSISAVQPNTPFEKLILVQAMESASTPPYRHNYPKPMLLETVLSNHAHRVQRV